MSQQYSQRVEGAQTLEGVRGQLRYLVVTQISEKKRAKEKRKGDRERHRVSEGGGGAQTGQEHRLLWTLDRLNNTRVSSSTHILRSFL